MEVERPKDPWRKILLLFVIFVLLVGCTNTPRNDDFITAWTIAVSVVGLCIGIVFSLVLRSLAKSIDAQRPQTQESDVEAQTPSHPPSYSKCCEAIASPDGLPSYYEAVAAHNSKSSQEKPAAVHVSPGNNKY